MTCADSHGYFFQRTVKRKTHLPGIHVKPCHSINADLARCLVSSVQRALMWPSESDVISMSY